MCATAFWCRNLKSSINSFPVKWCDILVPPEICVILISRFLLSSEQIGITLQILYVYHFSVSVQLVNSQVLLKGCETQGYVILSAAKSEILQRIHRPVWQDHSLVTKTTWFGSLECMQYYATVSAGDKETQMGKYCWFLVEVDKLLFKNSLFIACQIAKFYQEQLKEK